MKVIVAGSRDIDRHQALGHALRHLLPNGAEFSLDLRFGDKGLSITELVTGCCPTGPDQVPFMLDNWWSSSCFSCNFDIVKFPADWDKHGKAAGPIRNKQMAEYADALLLIWDGNSRGSMNMKKEAEKANLQIVEILI